MNPVQQLWWVLVVEKQAIQVVMIWQHACSLISSVRTGALCQLSLYHTLGDIVVSYHIDLSTCGREPSITVNPL